MGRTSTFKVEEVPATRHRPTHKKPELKDEPARVGGWVKKAGAPRKVPNQ
jgi:hypothetical protein